MTTYKEAGVDIDKATHFVKKIQALCPAIGGFSGLFPLGDDYLVASTDGVGTKLKLAFAMDLHHTIGIDLVAMNVNDILTAGAKPLFFLDYFSTSKLDMAQAEQIIKGIIQGCQDAECVLLGGETAEMPGFYQPGEYDLAGFTVGIVRKDQVIDGKTIENGDAIVGIASSGLHSNGYSLVRKILEKSGYPLGQSFNSIGTTLGEELLIPTRIYVKKIMSWMKKIKIKGMAHITGGGFIDNIPRVLPAGLASKINKQSWEVPPIFHWLQEEGGIDEEEMFHTFNMGIGLILILDQEDAFQICQKDHDCKVIGQIVKGEGVVWA